MPSSELTPPEVWSLILEESRKVINPQTYRTWLEPTHALGLDQERLLVSVKNQFAADYIEGQYGAMLADIAEGLFETQLAIDFKTDEPASSQSRAVPPAEVVAARPDPAAAPANLGMPLNPRYTFESFVVGNSNQWAQAASQAVAETPAHAYNPLFIYGGVGLGKTHLMQAIGNDTLAGGKLDRVCYLSAEQFMNQMVEALQHGRTLDFRNKYRRMDLLLIDDVQFLQGKDATQEEFFHTFNALYHSDRQIVVTSDVYPQQIPEMEERLISRFQSGMVADIQPPELDTRIAILQKKAEQEGIPLSSEVALFMAQVVKSNVRELEGTLLRLAVKAELLKRPIDLDLAKETLRAVIPKADHATTVEDIQRAVCEYFNIRLVDLKSHRQ
ncbi:MAG: chromosomal replication initiator protein DnaA, partial [Gemmatimonadetes bacterium]|nr:chromosomal replication initiator protein DnaA [Gemmatimonadota bacterium]